MTEGLLGTEFERADRQEVRSMVKDAENAAKDEVWASYRFIALADTKADSGLKVIDLGAGHSSANETLCGRVVTALKTGALLSETVGAGYLDRHWPPAFKETGAWPLTSLRQSFLNGSLTRLVDPDAALRRKIVEFVESGSFGLASGSTTDGRYERMWYREPVGMEEVAFDPSVFLLTRTRSDELHSLAVREPTPPPIAPSTPPSDQKPDSGTRPGTDTPSIATPIRLRVSGSVPPELWNRLGTKVIPRLRSGDGLTMTVEFSVEVTQTAADGLEADLLRVFDELGLGDGFLVERS